MDAPVIPKDWLDASREIARVLVETRKKRSRREALSIQKWIDFLRGPKLGGVWHGIEQRRQMVYARPFGYRNPLTCNPPVVNPAADHPSSADLRRLELEERLFLAENGIASMDACEVVIGKRKVIVPRPVFNSPTS